MTESCLKFSREFWKEKEFQIDLLPGLFPSQPRDTLLFVLMTLNPPPFQFTVVFLKVLLSPLSYFFSICLNSITLFTYLKKKYQPLVLQMIQTF